MQLAQSVNVRHMDQGGAGMYLQSKRRYALEAGRVAAQE